MMTTIDYPMTAPRRSHEKPTGPTAASGLFADIVFDRPLDHAYTYAVPDRPASSAIGVGKRVEAPFGRGDKATVGYCVRVARRAAGRARSRRSPASSTTRRCSTTTC